MVDMVQAALREVDLSLEQASAFEAALARQARELTAAPVGRKQLGGHLFCTRRACDLVVGYHHARPSSLLTPKAST
jgi:hypothetical protein